MINQARARAEADPPDETGPRRPKGWGLRMRLRRRPTTETPTPLRPVPETEAADPVAEAAFVFREIVESIPGGDREGVWAQVVAAVEQGLPSEAEPAPQDADAPAG